MKSINNRPQKSIRTLIPDIQELLRRDDGWFTDELASDLAKRLQFQFNWGEKRELSISQLGPKCPKALWHSINTPELAQPLRPQTKLMFKYGHIIEELVISLIKAAGHTVEGEQDAIYADGVVGHRDAIVDGCILDVKSSTTPGMAKFRKGTIAQEDEFGYLCQLDGYMYASLGDPRVLVKDKAYLLAVDKQLGGMELYEHTFREDFIRDRIRKYKEIVGRSSAPACECGTKAVGASGNIALDLRASYSPQKYCCFPDLRTFIYADGPLYLTRVVRRPQDHIIEVDRFGKPVYNGGLDVPGAGSLH